MATTWIVAADESRARVLQVTGRAQHLVEVEDLVNPEGRLKDRELTTDAHPRFRGTDGPANDREETSAVEHEFLGALRKELHKEVEKLVSEELPKDLSWLNAREIERYFAKGSGTAP